MNLTVLIGTMIASFIFFPSKDYLQTPDQFGLKFEVARIKTEDHVQVVGWFLSAPESRATIFLLHGNAGNIADRLFKVPGWLERKYSVFLLDYRGYGESEGKISSEQDLYRDAEAGLKWLLEEKKLAPTDIILYGESIGSAPAIYLATKHRFQGLILEAPFTSLPELVKKHYPFIPPALLGGFQFPNKSRMAEVKSPVFILHGRQDEICPVEMGLTLFESAREPKEFYLVEYADHNDLPFVAEQHYFDRPLEFIAKHSGDKR